MSIREEWTFSCAASGQTRNSKMAGRWWTRPFNRTATTTPTKDITGAGRFKLEGGQAFTAEDQPSCWTAKYQTCSPSWSQREGARSNSNVPTRLRDSQLINQPNEDQVTAGTHDQQESRVLRTDPEPAWMAGCRTSKLGESGSRRRVGELSVGGDSTTAVYSSGAVSRSPGPARHPGDDSGHRRLQHDLAQRPAG